MANLFPRLKHFTVLYKHLGQTYLADVSGVQLDTDNANGVNYLYAKFQTAVKIEADRLIKRNEKVQ